MLYLVIISIYLKNSLLRSLILTFSKNGSATGSYKNTRILNNIHYNKSYKNGVWIQLTPLESLNNIAACAGSKNPSEFFLELDIVPNDSRRVSGSRELLRKRAPS